MKGAYFFNNRCYLLENDKVKFCLHSTLFTLEWTSSVRQGRCLMIVISNYISFLETRKYSFLSLFLSATVKIIYFKDEYKWIQLFPTKLCAWKSCLYYKIILTFVRHRTVNSVCVAMPWPSNGVFCQSNVNKCLRRQFLIIDLKFQKSEPPSF